MDGSLVTVSHSSTAVTYQIQEKNLFDTQGYKILQRYYDSGFVKCSKGAINGKIRLTYDVSGYVTLSQLIPEMDNRSFLKITFHLLQTAIALREIGFLQRENIGIQPTDIFVDKSTFKTYLIYVPLVIRSAPNAHMVFEKKLRATLVQIADMNFKKRKSDFLQEIRADLANIRVSLQDIVTKIETQALQTTEENTQKVGGLHRFSGTKTYPPNTTENQQETEKTVKPSKAILLQQEELPKTDVPTPPEHPVQPQRIPMTPERKKKIAEYIGFFAGYSLILFVAIWVIAHYFSNSGLTVSFIVTMIGVLLVVLLIPVLFVMRKGSKAAPKASTMELLQPTPVKSTAFQPTIVLKNTKSETNLEFFISQKEYVIGKAAKEVDGFIPFDKTISDKHCKIIWNGKFYIQDLESDFGTFVNEDQVIPGQSFPIRSGDQVRLSKHVFLVKEI